jgi:hydrogenase expression/formation protein HypD
MKYGITELLPPEINLLHGPGCPVCVTPVEIIDKAIEIASLKGVIFCSFGDMLRVPGSVKDLMMVKAEGGDVRIMYSPLDALKIAIDNPGKQVVFFGVGFETTAPANGMSVYQAKIQKIENFRLLISQVLIPPAIELILNSNECKVQGLLAPGHVCTITGFKDYESIATKYRTPIVVTGFEPVDILSGIYMCVKLLEEGRFQVENQYTRVVHREGNIHAQRIIKEVFTVVPRKWRGIGEIPDSGLGLNEKYRDYDAEALFGQVKYFEQSQGVCISGLVLQGVKKPDECPAFSRECKPEHPLGATMVSAEGACSAYFRYKSTTKI